MPPGWRHFLFLMREIPRDLVRHISPGRQVCCEEESNDDYYARTGLVGRVLFHVLFGLEVPSTTLAEFLASNVTIRRPQQRPLFRRRIRPSASGSVCEV